MPEQEREIAPKIKTITLSKDPSETAYRVERITDSIDFTPGTFVEAAIVQGLCDAEDWKVTVVKPK